MNKIIFFGNGPLADAAKNILEKHCEIIFHARSKEDLETVKEIKSKNPEAKGILASFGVMIKSDILDIFEPEGILNIHPSLLPKYRGASPIESAILNGDNDFSVSIMKLVKAMDAGPVYYQTTLNNLPLNKATIYETLATTGANWLVENMDSLPEPTMQDEEKATFCGKFDRSMGELTPESDTAEKTFRKIIAYQDFPKPKHTFFSIKCIIKKAHLATTNEQPAISITCADGGKIAIDELQPEGRKAMDAKSFLNGYKK